MGKIFDDLHNFIQNVISTLRFNGMYIALSLILPYFLLNSNVGSDLVLYLTDDNTTKAINFQRLNVQLIIIAFIILAFSIWTIPTWGINIWYKLIWGKTKVDHLSVFSKMVCAYNKKSGISVKYIALLPWFLFIMACVLKYYSGTFLILILAVIFILFLIWRIVKEFIFNKLIFLALKLYDRCSGFSNKKKGYIAAIFVLATFGLLYILIGVVIYLIGNSKIVIIGSNLFFFFSVATYFYFVEYKLTFVKKETAYYCTDFIYGSLLISSILAALFLMSCNRFNQPFYINNLSPIFVIIIMISFILFLADLFFTSQITITDIQIHTRATNNGASDDGIDSKTGRLYNSMWQFIGLVIVILYFFSSNNSHNIRKIEVSETYYRDPESRPTLIGHFKSWYKLHNIDTAKDNLYVYLISGQGGGSRAAAWFYINMKNLESNNPDFYDNVFSVSTVSGSTSGAGMYLADRYYDFRKDSTTTYTRLKTMYARNYFSSIFYGILLGDGLEGLISINKSYPKDRNYYLQMEEAAAYNEAVNDSSGKYWAITHQDLYPKKKIETDAFFNYDYLMPYFDKKNRDTFYPLFFINSAVIDNGVRAVFSPVKMDSFSLAKDLYKAFKNCTPCMAGSSFYNIPLTTAICQSQSFPIINANNYVDCVGRMVDGGVYDNTGCTTTFEVYYTLKRFCETDSNYKNVKFVVVNLINNIVDKDFYAKFSRASILNTPAAAYKTMFGGHETYAYKFLNKYAKDNGDSILNICYTGNIPTTRILGERDIDSLSVASYRYFKSINPQFSLNK